MSSHNRVPRQRGLALAILASVALLALASAMPAFATPSTQASVALAPTVSSTIAASGTLAPQPLGSAAPDWINVTNPAANASPPATWGGSMAYDPVDNETIYFGGCGPSVCPLNETWGFADGRWTNLTDPRHAPPARFLASMDYDPNMGGVLLFGGDGASRVLNDTWLFRGGFWTNLSYVGPAPGARYAAAMAFDPQPEENGSVLFGGYVASVGYSNDTWVWQGWSGWVQFEPSVLPPATAFGALTYDAADGVLLLVTNDLTNQTWQFYSGQWWADNPSGTAPQITFAPSVLYDPSLAAVLFFGGAGPSGYADGTYTFAGNQWGSVAPAHAPPPIAAASLALDASGSVPVLFGGVNSTYTIFASTWVFETPPSAALGVAVGPVETSAPVNLTLTLAGGTSPYTATFDFGDNTTATVTSLLPAVTLTHTYSVPGTFAPSVIVQDSVGASASAAAPSLTVAAGPSITASSHPSVADVGSSMAFSAAAHASGIPPLAYTWQMGDGTTLSGASVSHAYSLPGTYTVVVTAVDSAGGTANATVFVQVNGLPSVSIAPTNASPAVGTPVGFSAPVAGGTAPYRYSWSFGDGSTSTSASPTHTFNSTGSFTVQVWANDSFGGGSHATFTVTVVSVAASSAAGAPPWFWAGLVALIAVAAVGMVLLVMRPHRGKPPEPSSPP